MGFYDNQIKKVCKDNPRLLIKAINSIFKKHHDENAIVTYEDTEQNDDEQTFMDMLVSIGSSRYHLEYQMAEDEMALRMYEYAAKESIGELKKMPNTQFYEIDVQMPRQVVVFLAGKNKSGHITTNLTLPDGNRITYEIPCISASISVEELEQEDLILFIPFQQAQLNDTMNHIKGKTIEAKKAVARKIYLLSIITKTSLNSLESRGIITTREKDSLSDCYHNIGEYLTDKDKVVDKEVADMGDKDYIPLTDRIEAQVTEKVTARVTEKVTAQITVQVTENNKRDFAISMLNENLPIDVISRCTGLAEDVIKQLQL